MSKDYYKNDKLGNRSHFITSETVDKHLDDIIYIYDNICSSLSQYPNFNGLDFCDVSAGGIQIRLFHKEVTGYCYSSVTVDYDFSNKEEVIEYAVESWESLDTKEHLNSYQSFLAAGEKYGWD